MCISVIVGSMIVFILIEQEHECQLTRDIVDLIDREVDLMTRGVKAGSLEGLRKRISTLFLQYIKTPAFNPEVAKLLKVSKEPCWSEIIGFGHVWIQTAYKYLYII